ncbi:polysaccharide biosynthesis C-terminal domain-containing protein [Methanococcoides orientis]|nr:polysaccharide biosynthesis C-terminal domain-containing protein [Methanococcoides orientis]
MSDFYKLFVQRVGLVGVTQLLVGISGLILLPILTKNLSINDYGIWVQIIITIEIISNVANAGLSLTMVRFLPSIKEKKNIQDIFYSLTSVILFTNICIAIVLYLFADSIATILFNENVWAVKILSLIVIIKGLHLMSLNYFRASQKIKRHSFFVFFETASKMLFVSFFILMNFQIKGAITGLLISYSFTLFVEFFYIFSDIGLKKPQYRNLKKYLAFGLPIVPSKISDWTISMSDRYIISYFFGTAFVGYYVPGYTLGNIINMFFQPLNFVLPMFLSKYYDENNIKRVEEILSISLKYFLAVSIPSVFGLSLLSKPLLIVLTTSEIASKSYLITPFVALSTLLWGIYSIFYQILLLEQKTKIIGKIWTISAILNILLNILLIPIIGIVAAAMTTLISYALSLVITSYYISNSIKIHVDILFIVKTVLASVIMSLLILKLDPFSLSALMCTIFLCAFVYFSTLLLLRGFTIQEIRVFINSYRFYGMGK